MKKQTFWSWLVKSSENPEKMAMTAKGIIISFVPVLIALLKTMNVDLTATEVGYWVNYITTSFGLALLAIGMGRKLYNTFK